MLLKDYYCKQTFQPTFVSILINPFYLIRMELYKSIKILAPELLGTMMDFGCGRKPYKDLCINVRNYIGVDIHNEGHSHDKEDIDIYYDGRHLPFKDEYFDSVFCSEVLEHVFNVPEALCEIFRVMKPGGKLLLTIPFAWIEHEIPNDFGRYTSYGIKNIIEKHGFEIEKFNKTGDFFKAVSQLRILYVHELLYTKNKYFNLLLNIVFIAPLTLWALIISALLPKRYTLYFNNVILAHKR